MLPDECAVIALVFDDAGKAVFSDLFRDQPLLNIILTVANRANKVVGKIYVRILDVPVRFQVKERVVFVLAFLPDFFYIPSGYL